MAPRRRKRRDLPHQALDGQSLMGFLPVVSTQARFPIEVFMSVVNEILAHPEHESSNIVRADLLGELPLPASDECPGLGPVQRFRRRLRPSRPFDGVVDQICTCYRNDTEAFVTLVPELCDECAVADLPFFHPDVSGIAYRYEASAEGLGTLQVDMRPRAHQTITRYEETSRVFRTALALLTSVCKRGEGRFLLGYKKRVHHDRLVARDEVQDMRLELKPKYAWAVQEWKESTDPTKHVFEDIAIAAYLIVLWKRMYKTGRPSTFVDLGCGNGFLTYILSQEGYRGCGIDLRSRRSWALWQQHSHLTPLALTADTLDLPSMVLGETSEGLDPMCEEAFLIGNHADEITPWIPLLAAKHRVSGFLNLACCAHDLFGPFTASSYSVPPQTWSSEGDREVFEGATQERGGRYAAYVNRVAEICLEAGYVPEREMLRISSTRNAAVICRRRFRSFDEVGPRVLQLARESRDNGWRPRKKDGKDH